MTAPSMESSCRRLRLSVPPDRAHRSHEIGTCFVKVIHADARCFFTAGNRNKPTYVRRWISASLVALATICLLGCGGSSRPEVASVKGSVTFQGKPLAGADVTFIRAGASLFSTGRTDAQGKFSLTTYEPNDGAIVGPNVVTIVMPAISQDQALPDSPLTGEYFELRKQSQSNASKRELPAHYADPTASGLAVEVVSGLNEPQLSLDE